MRGGGRARILKGDNIPLKCFINVDFDESNETDTDRNGMPH